MTDATSRVTLVGRDRRVDAVLPSDEALGTLVPELLAEPFGDLALQPIAGSAPARDVYALIPPGGRHPLLAATLDALDTTAAQLRGPSAR